MTATFKKFFYISFLLSVCFGFFLHFVYELSNYSRVVDLFSPINESPWEQIKLLFFPFSIFTIILYICTKRNSKNILFVNFVSVTLGMLLLICLHYTIHGAFGTASVIVDIIIYLASTAATFILCLYFLKNNTFFRNNTIGFILLVMLFLMFTIFTVLPPRIPLFQDPVTKSFGLIHQKV